MQSNKRDISEEERKLRLIFQSTPNVVAPSTIETVHPELGALKDTQSKEAHQLACALLLDIGRRDQEGGAELAHVHSRFEAARESMDSRLGVHESTVAAALYTLEYEELMGRIATQTTNRVRRLQRIHERMAMFRSAPDEAYEENEGMVQANERLERRLQCLMAVGERNVQQQQGGIPEARARPSNTAVAGADRPGPQATGRFNPFDLPSDSEEEEIDQNIQPEAPKAPQAKALRPQAPEFTPGATL